MSVLCGTCSLESGLLNKEAGTNQGKKGEQLVPK